MEDLVPHPLLVEYLMLLLCHEPQYPFLLSGVERDKTVDMIMVGREPGTQYMFSNCQLLLFK